MVSILKIRNVPNIMESTAVPQRAALLLVRNRFLAKSKSATTAFCKEYQTMSQYNTVFSHIGRIILPRHEIDRFRP